MGVHPRTLNVISICTGGAGLDIGVELAIPSARVVCMVEREFFAIHRLVSAMEEGLLAPAPIWTDARTFNGRPWRGSVDFVIGGIPCQPHSSAGKKKGSLDERDLWSPTRRTIVQARPRYVLIENVGGMLSAGDDEIAGAERVFRDFHKLGFSTEGGLFTAQEVGAPHGRERIFILAVADADGEPGRQQSEFEGRSRARSRQQSDWGGVGILGVDVADAGSPGLQRGEFGEASGGWDGPATSGSTAEFRGPPLENPAIERSRTISVRSWQQGSARNYPDRPSAFPPGPADLDGWRGILERAPHLEPSVCRVADGVASHVDELRMLGNGVVPLQAAYALRTLTSRLAARGSAGAIELMGLMQ